MSLPLGFSSAGDLAVYGHADQVSAILALGKHGVDPRPRPVRQPQHDRFRKQFRPTHFAYPLLTPTQRISYIRFIDKGDREMSTIWRKCVNCGTTYRPTLRKCPASFCRASRKFSCEETEAHHAARVGRQEELEALLQQFAGCAK